MVVFAAIGVHFWRVNDNWPPSNPNVGSQLAAVIWFGSYLLIILWFSSEPLLLNEYRSEKLDMLVENTLEYIEANDYKFRACANTLLGKRVNRQKC